MINHKNTKITYPKISIIIPIFNSEKYIRKCLNSLINQSFHNYEIICVNDGSTDNSIKILKEYKESNKSITLINQQHSNAGVARNAGLRVAKGEYVAFLDADDYFLNNAFDAIFEKIKKNKEVELIVFGALSYNEANKRTKQIKESISIKNCPQENPFSPIDMSDYLFNSFRFWAWNKLYKRNMLEKYNIRFQNVERSNDVTFVAASLLHAQKIMIINDYYVVHREGHCTNMQANNVDKPLEFWKAYKEVVKQAKKIEKENYI
ncbi:MAG: glycosyltransferase family 2 protein, partial [Erysipelotrichaceae bacterium]|nr:glycosyltransferase family 2 protein [Erysipelotrichaceae bacterium]